MFKGTPSIGTKDYQKDLEIIAAQEHVRDEMRLEDRKMRAAYRRGEIDDLLKPENKTPRYRELEKEFTKLIAEQRDSWSKTIRPDLQRRGRLRHERLYLRGHDRLLRHRAGQ